MLFALGAVSSALGALQSLTSSNSSSASSSAQATGFLPGATNPFDSDGDSGAGTPSSAFVPTSGTAGGASISPQTMSALIAAQGQSTDQTTPMSRSDALNDLFSQIDGNGDGQISKSEFENALGAGGTNLAQADDVFSKMDANGDGSISVDEMAKALKGGGGHHHHAGGAGGMGGAGASGSGGGDGSSSDPLLQALDGSSSTSVTNSDGSTTTTITYADGSKVDMTTAAASTSGSSSSSNSSSSSSSATSSYNWIEQMIQREAQAISASAASSLSISA